eukprot:GGOE01025693.1.p1 GENE.GGOE01025693.1~~GGOE01025693.1.p1  ORF type:complete len:138 (-),score=3.58 GGOE01025693.1:824-1189(-)
MDTNTMEKWSHMPTLDLLMYSQDHLVGSPSTGTLPHRMLSDPPSDRFPNYIQKAKKLTAFACNSPLPMSFHILPIYALCVCVPQSWLLTDGSGMAAMTQLPPPRPHPANHSGNCGPALRNF